uniref:Interleukin-20 receptor subunit alpha-like n=1 Tax=Xiphophorus maculatus TaxID=8083 RepID=A0A3B5Q9S9_XIPMA
MLAPPGQARFESTDFKNILQWAAPTNSSCLQYHVQYKIYGELDWLNVSNCQGIQRHHCDLSAATSDVREWYYARVRVSCAATGSKSAWAMSRRFSPRWDSKRRPSSLTSSPLFYFVCLIISGKDEKCRVFFVAFSYVFEVKNQVIVMTTDCVSAAKVSPPSVRLNSSKQGLVVQVKASRVLMRKVHNGVDNNIYVVHPGGKEEVYEVASGSKLTLTELKPRTHYCVQAQTVIPRHMRSSDRSTAKCITTD